MSTPISKGAALQHVSTGYEFELRADTLVGTSARCDLILDHPSVSRAHASLYWQEGAWYIQDRNSKNGTWLNGRCLTSERQRLQADQHLRFGAQGEWRLLSVAPPSLVSTSSSTAPLEKQIAHARISIREGQQLSVTAGSISRTLQWRAPYATLLALGSERLQDRQAARATEEQGWVDRVLLAERLGRDINQDIFRIRQDFSKLELFADAEDIIEDRREEGKVRLAVEALIEP